METRVKKYSKIINDINNQTIIDGKNVKELETILIDFDQFSSCVRCGKIEDNLKNPCEICKYDLCSACFTNKCVFCYK